jgi:hypothetical protein
MHAVYSGNVNIILYSISFSQKLPYISATTVSLCQDLALLIAVSTADLLPFSSCQYFITLWESAFHCHTDEQLSSLPNMSVIFRCKLSLYVQDERFMEVVTV